MSLARIILYLLTGIFVAQVVYYYPNLPPTMATHFDSSGNPNGWMSKETSLVFDALILFIVYLQAFLPQFFLTRVSSSFINLPNKEYWLAEERRDATFAKIRQYFEWLSVVLLAFFIGVNQLAIEANLNRESLNNTAFLIFLGGFFAFMAVWLVKFYRAFKIKI